jgi:hypothetical protein
MEQLTNRKTSPESPQPLLVDIVLPLEQSEDEAARKEALAAQLKVASSRISEFRLRKHSIDARQRQI